MGAWAQLFKKVQMLKDSGTAKRKWTGGRYDDVRYAGIGGDGIGAEGSTGIYVPGLKSSQEHELERLRVTVEGLRIKWFVNEAMANGGTFVCDKSTDANIWIPSDAMDGGSRGCGVLEGVLARVLKLPPGHVVDAVLLLDRVVRSLDASPDRRVAHEAWLQWKVWNAWCTPEQLQRGIEKCMALGQGCPIEADTVASMFA